MATAGTGLRIDRERREHTVLVRARGELDLQTAAALCAPVDAAIARPAPGSCSTSATARSLAR